MVMSSSFQRSLLPLVTVGAGLALGLGTHRFVPHSEPLAVAAWAIAPIVIGLAGSLAWWRVLDEVAREAHKTAWFWGGALGLMIVMVGFLIASRIEPGLITTGLHGGTDPDAFVALGILAAAGAQLIGYGLVWAGWWIAKR